MSIEGEFEKAFKSQFEDPVCHNCGQYPCARYDGCPGMEASAAPRVFKRVMTDTLRTKDGMR